MALVSVGRDVILGRQGRTIIGFSAKTGKVKWRATNPRFSRLAVVNIGGAIAVVSGGSLSCGD